MEKIKKWLYLVFSIFAFAFVSMFQSVPNKVLKDTQRLNSSSQGFEEFNYNLFYVENQKFEFDNGSYINLINGVFSFYGNFNKGVSFEFDLINEFNYDYCYLLCDSKLNYSNGNSSFLEFDTGTKIGNFNSNFGSDMGSVDPFKTVYIGFDCNYTLNGEKIYVSLSSVELSKYQPNLNYIYNQGYNDGYDIGEDNGYNHGYDEGYEEGYKNGLIEDNANIYSLYSDLYFGVTEGDSMPNLKNYKFTTPYYSSGFEITKNSISPTQSMFESVEVAIENGSQKNNFFVLDFTKSGGLNVNRYPYFGFSRYDYGINIQILDEQNNLYFLYSADYDFNSFKSINIKDITNGINILKIGVNASNSNSLYFTIACDNSYNQGFNQGYEEGNNNGFNDGYEEGHNNGYLEGLEQGRADNDSYGIAPFVQSIFNGFGNMLSVEIFPSIKLWYLIGIPLIFGIVRFVIGWFK